MPQIAEWQGVSIRTLYGWVKALMSGGINWILANSQKSGRGRKPKLTKQQQAELKKQVLEGPEANGFESGVWNTAMVTLHRRCLTLPENLPGFTSPGEEGWIEPYVGG